MTEAEPAYRGRIKYTPEKARQYQNFKPSKMRAELRLVERAFRVIPTGTVLDAPCGGGRVALMLAGKGYQVTAADLSESMVEITRENVAAAGVKVPVEQQDVERFTFPDRTFDSVISFRLFHHFPTPEIRLRVVRELCRVAKSYVAISYFSPYSVTSWRRSRRAARGGRVSQKHSTSLAEVRSYFESCGFTFVQDCARFNLIHTLHVAVFRRTQP